MTPPLKGRFGSASFRIGGESVFWLRTIQHCATCQARRRTVVTHHTWTGPIATCCGCGESWTDSGKAEHGYYPGWQDDAIADAKWRWRRAEGRAAFELWQQSFDSGPSIVTVPDVSTWEVPA